MTTHSLECQAAPEVHATARKAAVLVGALMVQVILGTVYGYSIFWQPLEAMLWPPIMTVDQADSLVSEGVQPADGSLIVADAAAAAREREHRISVLKYAFAICLLSFAASMVLAGRLQDMKGPRFTACLGGVMLGAAFVVAGAMNTLAVYYTCHAVLMGAAVIAFLVLTDAFTRGTNPRNARTLEYIRYGIITAVVVVGVLLAQSYVSNSPGNKLLLLWGTVGLLAGMGIGFAYVCPIAALVKWFPQHKGLVSGVAVAGFGMGAYVLSGRTRFGGVGFIEAHGIESFFLVHGIVAAVVVCGGALLLRNPAAPTESPNIAEGPTVRDSNWRDLLRTGRFYVVWAMFFSGAMAGLMVIGILKPFAGSQLLRAAEQGTGALAEPLRNELLLRGATAVGVLALFNAAGRVVWGWVSDGLGRGITMTVMFIFQGFTLLSLTTLDTDLGLAVGAACVGFNFGGNFALFPSLTADLFGSKNFGSNYGWVFTSYGIAGVFGVWAGNTAQQISGSYFGAFAAAAVLCFASAVLSLWIARTRRVAGKPA